MGGVGVQGVWTRLLSVENSEVLFEMEVRSTHLVILLWMGLLDVKLTQE